MKLLKISIQGFKSFKEEQVFTFPDEAGVYFISGKNLVDVELEGNGAGKSSLLDAVSWVFFGKTSVGIRAGDAANWDLEVLCKVELEFVQGGENWKIVRTWKPNSLNVSKGSEAAEIWDQDSVEDLIGMTYDSFLRIMLFSQFGTQFFDLKPSDKLKILSPILDLDIWEIAAKVASDNKSQLEGGLHDTNSTLSEIVGKLEAYRETSYKEDITQWEETQIAKEGALKKEISEIVSKINGIKVVALDLLQQEKDLQAMKLEITSEAEFLDGRMKLTSKAVQQFVAKRIRQEATRSAIDKRIQEFDELVQLGKCPTCQQVIADSTIEARGDEFEEALGTVEEALGALERSIIEAEDVFEEARRSRRELDDPMEEFRSIDRQVAIDISAKKSDTRNYSMMLGRYKQQLAVLKDEKNPYEEKQRALKELISNCVEQAEFSEKEIIKFEEEISKLDFWVTGFKKLRLFVMQAILSQFSMEINNSLQALGLGEWEIELKLDKENKSGNIRNEFTVFVKGPSNEKFVPWEAWSGGERHRLRFAGSLGLANLIKSSRGLDMVNEFFDEPTNWMTPKGVQGLLEVLRDRAITENKVILLIDHKDMDTFDFAGRFTVVKDQEGSHFEEFTA